MTQTRIPSSIEEVIADLDGLAALLTAKEWERAAIVYAFTEMGTAGRKSAAATSEKLSLSQFAALGIAGLRTHEDVGAYRQAWADAMLDGAPDAVPGATIELPHTPWVSPLADRRQPAAREERAARRFIRENPDAIERIVRNEPELGVEVARQVVETPATRVPVESRLTEHVRERQAQVRPVRTRDFSEDVTTAVNLLIPALHAIERGEWTPGTTQQMLLHFLAQLLELAGNDHESTPDLFGEIDRYLKEAIS